MEALEHSISYEEETRSFLLQPACLYTIYSIQPSHERSSTILAATVTQKTVPMFGCFVKTDAA